MKTIKYKCFSLLVLSAVLVLLVSSCVNDLDTLPLSPTEQTASNVFTNQEKPYIESLAKIYAGMALGGNAAGDGDQDVIGIDGGSQSSFLRTLWNMQELSTDIAHCAWNDEGIPGFNMATWQSNSPWVKGNYYRLYFQINLCNAFLRETTENLLDKRECSEELKLKIKTYRSEARVLRALFYYYLLDLYRNVPLLDETSPIGEKFLPSQVTPKELFNFIEKELVECINEGTLLKTFIGYDTVKYGHIHESAAWAILVRLYLNAEIYIAENKYTECVEASNKIINEGYELEAVYGDLFKADNDRSKEMIFAIRYEGDQTLTWGGMTALLCWGATATQNEVNAKGAWQGVRAKSSLIKLFEKENNSEKDTRKAMLRTELTESIYINEPTSFNNNGAPVTKYFNVYKDGSKPASAEAYVDFPLFRLAEVYLSYAEAVLKGGTGDAVTALSYINKLRERAYINKELAKITGEQLTLDFLSDEWGREFFFEAHRRTNLVRFNKFVGGNYNWEWKGGVQQGKAIDDHLKIYPLPSDEIGSNLKLKQNDKY